MCFNFAVHNWDPTTRAGMKCGFCKLSTGDYKRGDKERQVFDFLYAKGLPKILWTVRDRQVGCGSKRCPDGGMQLPVALCTELECGGAPVLFILEVDEHAHVGNTLQCEVVRVHELSDSTRSAVYMLRYNPDAPGGLEDAALTALYERIMQILSEDHKKALDEPCLIVSEYIGYKETRVQSLADTQQRLHMQASVAG